MAEREFIPISEIPDPSITTEMPPVEIEKVEPIRLPHEDPEIAAALEEAQRQQDEEASRIKNLGGTALRPGDMKMMAGYDDKEREIQKRMEEQKRAQERAKQEQDRLERERRQQELQKANERLEKARQENEKKRR